MTADLTTYLARELRAPALRLIERSRLDHQSHRLYDAWDGKRRLIVKEFVRADKLTLGPLREFRALEALRHLDLTPVPVLCALEPGLLHVGPLVVYEFMDGEMWDRQPRTEADMVALADGWRRMNGLPTEGLWPSAGGALHELRAYVARFAETYNDYAAWAAAEFSEGGAVAEACLKELERGLSVAGHLESSPPVRCFCRSDPRFANVIARPDGRIGFVDWEDSGLHDPACDVADLLVHANQEDVVGEALWQVFLAHYVPSRAPVDGAFVDRVEWWKLLFYLRWIQKNMVTGLDRARGGRLAGWAINDRPPNWRLRRYLARARAWPNPDFSAHLAAAQAYEFFPGIG
jgi:aminoglycoside phosphotransferase (APT) family kinase protein